MKITFAILVTSIAVVVGLSFNATNAQDPDGRQPFDSAFDEASTSLPRPARSLPLSLRSRMVRSPKHWEDAKLQAMMNEIMRELKNLNGATTDEEKAKAEDSRKTAEDKLRATLGQQFDLLMKNRERQIVQLQKQISTLESEVKKRKDAKKEIVELRIKTLLNEANGLGFPGLETTSPSRRSVWSIDDPFSATISIAPRSQDRSYGPRAKSAVRSQ